MLRHGAQPTAYVILGMLRTRSHTGYEIKSIVDHSTRFFWAASYGQIYPELKRLEEAGLVEGEAEPQGGRRRRLYSLTAEGRRALEEWITSGRAAAQRAAPRGPAALLLRRRGRAARTSSSSSATIRAEHERTRREMQAIRPKAEEARAERGQEFPLMTLEFGIAYQEFVIEWCSQDRAPRSRKTGS